jgi:hypothetical protein
MVCFVNVQSDDPLWMDFYVFGIPAVQPVGV